MMQIRFFCVMVAAFLLAACGGGGGSNSINMTPQTSGGESQTAFSQARSVTQTANFLAKGANSLKRIFQEDGNLVFGSVVQAHTAGLSAVSGVNTSFVGDRFTLEIERQDGNNIRLDTNRDAVSIVNSFTPAENPITDRPAVTGYLGQASTSEVTVAGALVEWSSTDYTDYMAGGYWVHLDFEAQGVEMGAFADGPDYEGTVSLPVTGTTATYTGYGGGAYFGQVGSDSVLPTGTVEMGEYSGNLNLVANFGTNTISGGIDNIDLLDVYQIAPNGNARSVGDFYSSGYELEFGTTSIEQNGQFTGNDVSLTHPDLSISGNGSWAGRFSTVDDSAGNPRAVVGTHKGYAVTPGGSEAVFVGVHYGATNQFE